MRSEASIKGHPLHPVLVCFPIAFFTGTFILDILLVIYDEKNYGIASVYALKGGIIFGVLAAVFGIIDFIYTVPPKSSAKTRGMKHGLLNTCVILIFIIALVLRSNNDAFLYLIIVLEGCGVVLMSISGWLGGTLVLRNQIGVDHRYANAGKWKEETIIAPTNSIELKDLDSLKNDQMKLLHVNSKRIVIARTGTEIMAFEDRCTHRGASLAGGVMICGTVQCPWHGSQFECKTGKVMAGPA